MVDEAPPGMTASSATPPPPKQAGLFAPKPKSGADLNRMVSDLAGEVNNISRRMMILEERYTTLRKKSQLTDQNFLNGGKKASTDMHTVHEQIDELKKDLDDTIEKMRIIVRELKECAKHSDVEVLQKYINLWQPLNFVTRDTVTKLVSEEVESQFRDLNIRLQQEGYIKEQIRIAMMELKRQSPGMPPQPK